MDAIRRGAISPITHRTDIPPSAQGRAILYILLGDTKISLDSHYETTQTEGNLRRKAEISIPRARKGRRTIGRRRLVLIYTYYVRRCIRMACAAPGADAWQKLATTEAEQQTWQKGKDRMTAQPKGGNRETESSSHQKKSIFHRLSQKLNRHNNKDPPPPAS